MSSIKIQELKKQRQKNINLKKSQKKYFYIVLFFSLILLLLLSKEDKNIAITWLIAILMGFIMQRSRFCFAASFRDPIMVGSTSLFRAVVLGLIIATLGFGFIQYNEIQNMEVYILEEIPGNIEPVGLHTVFGSIIFGIGMVIAGGCVSGALVRVGEGSLMQFISLIGISIGAGLGSYQFRFWDKYIISKSSRIYLPNLIGFFPALFIQLLILIVLYYLAKKYDDKNNIMAKM